VPEGEQTEYRIFVGEWVDTREFADRLEQLQNEQLHVTPASEDEVEFVSPRVQGRMSRGLLREGG
jgi:hypothetical protein